MSHTALSFSYNGLHLKGGKYTQIDPMKHLKMLIAAIDCANPEGKCDVIVSAISFDFNNLSLEEKNLALKIYKKAKVVSTKNKENHQNGAALSIKMAIEAAASINAKYLIHLAEDIIMSPDFIEYFEKHLSDCDYVGTHWFVKDLKKRTSTLNTQVFGCRVSSFFDENQKKSIIFQKEVKNIEIELYDSIISIGLKYKIGACEKNLFAYPDHRTVPYPEGIGGGPLLYEHTHDPDEFRKIIESRGVKWTENDKKPTML